MHWMNNGSMGYGMGHGVFGMIFMIIFWGMILWGIVSLVKLIFTRKTGNINRLSSATEIARERYARGEIKKDEFDRIIKDLQR